jgi:hypothetical protein
MASPSWAGVFGPVQKACDGAGIGGSARNQRMSQQPELTSPSFAASPAHVPGGAAGPVSESVAQPDSEVATEASAGPQGERPAPQRIPRWLERAELFLRVVLRMYIGVAICYAPWSRLFWDQNPLFLHYPGLSVYAANGAVRGIISGLGLLNLWIAFHDAFRYRGG